jgi:hypothetical protein
MDGTEQNHRQLWTEYMQLLDFVIRLDDPEGYAFAVSQEVRNEARSLLGKEPHPVVKQSIPSLLDYMPKGKKAREEYINEVLETRKYYASRNRIKGD